MNMGNYLLIILDLKDLKIKLLFLKRLKSLLNQKILIQRKLI